MTKQDLLDALCDFTRDEMKDLILPVQLQEDDESTPLPRAPDVYDHGLPDFSQAEKKVPYIIHQVITANDVWRAGQQFPESKTVVRSIFAVYHEDSQEGQRVLLGMLERLRIALWRQRVIGKQFKLDMKAGADYLIYEKQLPPFYAGEMLTTWELPSVKLEVTYGKQGYSNIRKVGPDGHVCGGGHYEP